MGASGLRKLGFHGVEIRSGGLLLPASYAIGAHLAGDGGGRRGRLGTKASAQNPSALEVKRALRPRKRLDVGGFRLAEGN